MCTGKIQHLPSGFSFKKGENEGVGREGDDCGIFWDECHVNWGIRLVFWEWKTVACGLTNREMGGEKRRYFEISRKDNGGFEKGKDFLVYKGAIFPSQKWKKQDQFWNKMKIKLRLTVEMEH